MFCVHANIPLEFKFTWILYGRCNFAALVDEGSDEGKAAVDPYFDYMTTGFKVGDEANGGNDVVLIIDWDGFTVRNFNCPTGIHEIFP